MSWRILCFHHIPDPDAFGWADAILHPGTTLQELTDVAAKFAWEGPLKVSLEPGEEPYAWILLRHLWHEIHLMTEKDYAVFVSERLTPKEATPGHHAQ